MSVSVHMQSPVLSAESSVGGQVKLNMRQSLFVFASIHSYNFLLYYDHVID